jgi:hypothetical protein
METPAQGVKVRARVRVRDRRTRTVPDSIPRVTTNLNTSRRTLHLPSNSSSRDSTSRPCKAADLLSRGTTTNSSSGRTATLQILDQSLPGDSNLESPHTQNEERGVEEGRSGGVGRELRRRKGEVGEERRRRGGRSQNGRKIPLAGCADSYRIPRISYSMQVRGWRFVGLL